MLIIKKIYEEYKKDVLVYLVSLTTMIPAFQKDLQMS